MTKREFYNHIISNNITDEVIATAMELSTKLDENNSKRATKANEKRVEINAPKIAKIEAYLANCTVPQLLTDIAKATELSVPTISGLSREQIANGKWASGEKAVKGKGKQKTLILVGD